MSKLTVLREFFEFSRSHKKLWLLPVIIILLMVGIVLVVGQGSAVAPFIYTLF